MAKSTQLIKWKELPIIIFVVTTINTFTLKDKAL